MISEKVMYVAWPVWTSLPMLDDRQVHIWRVFLDWPLDKVEQARVLLSSSERAQVDRFICVDQRRRFVVRRAVLRDLAAAYLKLSTAGVSLSYGLKGKPYLNSHTSLHLNVSSSHDVALYAFVRHQAVGIDIERLVKHNYLESVMRRFFSDQEQAYIAALPLSERFEAFFTVWTLKEAYVKALGEGVFSHFNRFSVDLSGELYHRFSIDDMSPAFSMSQWSLSTISSVFGYAAALAVSAPNLVVRYGAWVHFLNA